MSILRTLNTGATGLSANGDALGVVGDNIANTNTIGFKRSRAVFQDLVTNAGRAEILQIGAGSRLAHVEQMWQQGALLSTASPTDLSLSGEGFFMVQGNASGVDGRSSRAPSVPHRQRRYLVNTTTCACRATGGRQRRRHGSIGMSVSVPMALPATATQQMTWPSTWTRTPSSRRPGPALARAVQQLLDSVDVYDSLGNAHQITTYYAKTSVNTWSGTPWSTAARSDSRRASRSRAPAAACRSPRTARSTPRAGLLVVGLRGRHSAAVVNFDFGASIADGGTGLEATTNFGSASANNSISQNACGWLGERRIGQRDGVITGVFSNGQRRTLGQVAVAPSAASTVWRAPARDSGRVQKSRARRWSARRHRGPRLDHGRYARAVERGHRSRVRRLIAYQRGFSANAR